MLKNIKNVRKIKIITLVFISIIMIFGFYINAIAIDFSNGTINPVYKPEWTKVSSTIDTTNKTITINLKGNAQESQEIDANTEIDYSSNVKTNLTKDDITVYINGEEAPSITKALSVASPDYGAEVTHTLTLSGFEQTTGRQANKNFLEWSGNVSIKIGGRGQSSSTYTAKTLVDDYGNQYMMEIDETGTWISVLYQDTATDHNTNGTMFTDYVKPEFSYAYSSTNPDINTGAESVTVVFDVTDKYFESTALSSDSNGNLITVIVDDDENANTPITKVLTRIKDVYYDKIAGITYVEPDANGTGTKVGERYQLVITGLDREDGFSYSGPMTLSFGEGKKDGSGNLIAGIIDKSGNLSAAKSITMGVNEPGGDPDDEIVVDVVDPIWKVQNAAGQNGKVDVTTDANGNVTASMTLIGTDKYFKQSTLTKDDIQIKVDGVADITSTAPDLVKSLSTAIYIKLDASGNYVETTSSDPDVIGVKYTFTISGFKESDITFFANRADYNTNPETGRPCREYSGDMTIIIKEKTLKDETGNESNELEIPLDHVDTLKPEIVKVSGTHNINATNVELSTFTVVFDIVDKYLDTSAITTTDTSKIHVYMDGEPADTIVKTITNIQQLNAEINGTPQKVGYRYTLELSNFQNPRTSIDYTREYTDWSGDLAIKIDANTARDTSNTGNAETILYGNEANSYNVDYADFIDFIKPDATYKFLTSDIDATNKKFTMKFDITDKFYNEDLSLTDLQVLISAENETDSDGYYDLMTNDKIGKSLVYEDITNTVNGASKVIGKRYTLVLSNLEQLQKIEGNYYLDYSGSITIIIPANSVKDKGPAGDGNNKNGNDITSITSGINIPGGEITDIEIVDVVHPLWERESFTTDIHNKTATITVVGSDKDFWEDDASTTEDDKFSTLTLDEIKLFVNGTETTGNITIDEGTKLYEERIVETEYGDGSLEGELTTETVQYGVRYVITITDFTIDAKQVKIQLIEGSLKDKSNNLSRSTEFMVYNTLISTSGETSGTSKFLNEIVPSGRTAIARQDIEQVVFMNSTSGSTAAGVQNVWDVSAQRDSSILAWYSETSAPYTVYIGSKEDIYGNVNSSYLFSYIGKNTTCTKTETIKNLNLLHTANVTDMKYMFQYCGYNVMTSLTLPTTFDTKNVTDMSYMFANCGYTAMTTLNLGTKFNTSKVEDMQYMFYKCGYKALTGLDLSSGTNASNITQFDTAKVENMSHMFNECGKALLGSMNLGNNFNTKEVTDMSSMFYNCGREKLTTLNLGGKFNTEKVTKMSFMFSGMTKLTSLNLGDKFNTKKVEDMQQIFSYLNELEYLDLGDEFYTTSATNMNRMFRSCSKLKVLDLGPAFTRIADGTVTFEGATIDAYTKMFDDAGTSNCIIYAPESIYNDRKHFKVNTDSSTTIEYTNGTIIPVYRPEWERVSTSVDTANKEITVTFKGYANESVTTGTYTGGYTSKITSSITAGNDASDLIVVKVDGEVAEEITQTVTEVSVTDNEVQYTIKLSGFQETTRQNGKYKNFLEWSGNIAIQPKKGTLEDIYGNKNMTSIDYTLNNTTNTVINPYVSDGKWYDIEFRDTTQEGSTSSATSGNWTSTLSTNTAEKMYGDFIKPEFTYEYYNATVDTDANTEIDYVNNKITIVFDVTDKYFASTQLATDTTGSLITVKVDNDANANTAITKALSKKTIGEDKVNGNLTYKTNGDIYYNSVNGVSKKIGERYELVITGLESSNGHGYSGPLTLNFPAEIITDQSNNKSIAKTITIGIDEPTNPDHDGNPDTEPDHTEGEVVDVVNPIWSYATSDIDRTNNQVNIYIVGSDKYYASNSLTKDNITVYVDNSSTTVDTDRDGTLDGNVTSIVKTLTQITDATQISTLATQAGLSTEITNNLTKAAVVYKLTLSNFGTISGQTKVVLPAETLVDTSNNKNTETTINVGNVTWTETGDNSTTPRYPAFRESIVDFLIPRINYTYSAIEGAENPDVDYEQKKVTLKFTVTDKYLLESDLIKKDAEGNLTTLPKNMAIKVDGTTVYDSTLETQAYQVTASITESNIANGKEYTLVVSNIQQELDAPPTNTTPENGDGFNFSGTMQVEFTAGVIDDTSGNKNIATTITLDTEYSDIVDVVDPIIKYSSSSIDKTNNTVTLNVLAEDKYISQGLLAENVANVKVKVQRPNGVVVNDTTTITKEITRTNRLATSMTYQIILSGFGLNEGITSVIIPKDMILDTSGNGNVETEIFVGNPTDGTAFKDSIVDFTEPVWNYDTSSIDRDRYTNGIAHNQTGTVTIDIEGTDIYFDNTYFTDSSKQLTTSDIKVYVNGVENTTITKTLATNADGSIFKESVTETDVNGDIQKGVRYRLILGNFGTNDGAVKIEVDDDVIRDISVNSNITTPIDVGNVSWVEDDEPLESADLNYPKYKAFRSDIVDFINPLVTYKYEAGVNPLIDRTTESVQIKFNVTDTNFLESNIEIGDITIFVDGIDVTGVLTKPLTSAAITDGSGNGITYTLTLSQFELENLLEGDIYKKHSGAIKLVIAAGQVEDTSGNKNVETTLYIDYNDGKEAENDTLNQYEDLDGDGTLDSGEDEEGVIVDFIDPIIYYHSQYINWNNRYAEITLRATDRFYDSSASTLLPSDITLYELNNAGQWVQVTNFADGKTTITSSSNGHGKDFTIKLNEFEDEYKMKIVIPAGKIVDTSDNYNQLTEIEVTLDNQKPRWQYVSADTTAFESTGTINFNVKGVDKFLDLTNSKLEVSDLKVLLDGEDITNADNITLSTPVDDTTEKSKAYTISVSGLTTMGTYTLVFAEKTLIDEFRNESAVTTINFSKSAIAVNTGNYVNVTYYVTPDNETVHHSFVHELMSVNTTGTNLENTTYRPSSLGELHNGGENPLFAEPDGESFAGWAVADEDGNIIQSPYKVYGLYDEIPNTVVNLKAVWQDATVIYVSSTGNNSNDGITPTTPVADLTTAFDKLSSSGTAENNIIVVMDAIEWNSSTTMTKNATITSLYAGIDYRATQNAELKISSNMTTNADIIFDNIELYSNSTTVSDGTNYLANGTYANMLIANYANVTLGRRVTTPDGKYTFGAIVGGNYKTETTTGTIGTHTIRVEAGRYNNIIAGSAFATATTTTKVVTHEVVIGNMRDAAVSRNDKLTITGYVTMGELTGATNTYEQSYSNVTLYSGTFTGENTFNKSSEDVAIYMRSLYGSVDGSTHFEMYGGAVDGNIYAGSRKAATQEMTVVNTMNFYGGTVTGNIFGQGVNDSFTGSSDILLSGRINITGNVFGGSNVTIAGKGNGEGNITITVDSMSATVTGDVFGGSNGLDNSGYITGDTTVEVYAGVLNNLYGSGKNTGNSNYAIVGNMNGIISGNIVGGAYNGQSGDTAVAILGGTVSGNIYGGNENTTQQQLDGDTNLQNGQIIIGDPDFDTKPTISGNIYGGGKFDKSGTVDITLVKSENVTSVFGGSNVNSSVQTVNIYLQGMTVNQIYGGGQENGTVNIANIYLQSGTATEVYGGGYKADVNESEICLGILEDDDIVTGGTATVETIFGSSNASGRVGHTNIVLGSGNLTNVFGGGNSTSAGETSVILYGITIDTIHGGSKNSGTVDLSFVGIVSGTVNNVFGGGLDVGATSTSVIQIGGTVKNIYGGNNSTVTGDGGTVGTSNIEIIDSTVENVYGGNYLKGTTQNAYITIHGDSTITGKLYGGGYKSNIGTAGTPGSTSINIAKGTIEGDINGGSEEGIVYGTTNINIGFETIDNNAITMDGVTADTAGNIKIKGNIYGAGSSTLAPNRDTAKVTTNYNYDYVSVVGDTHIKMDNSTTSPIIFSGSIFGAGNGATYNNGTTSDNSTIHIKDLGTSTNAHQMVSIERTGRLFIGKSFVELLGRQDINNYYKKTSYTINRITRGLTVHDNTTLYTRRGFNMVGGFNSFVSISEVTGNGTKASVTITDGAIGTKNVDNRLYTLEGINLIFSKEEGPLPTSTNWGEVNGMTFFGMYEVSSTGNKVYDIYNPDVYDSSYTGTLVEKYFANGTYVEGLHEASHNINIDGFYTIEADYEAGKVAATVIQPTPASATYYDWLIGADRVTYNLSLIGSISGKESVAELLLDYNYAPNATYTFDRVSLNALNLGVNLVEPSSIGLISANANNTFGLTVETDNAGWRNQATTSVFSTDSDTTYNNGSFVGDTIYKTDNTSTPGTIKFKLHNSINITEKEDLGNVNLILTGKTTTGEDASEGNTFIIVIAVNLQTVVETQVEEYIPSFTDNQYTELNYTTDSRVDLSYIFYKEMETTPYASGDYRVISTTTQLPAGTTLTLKDYGQGNSPKYYYYHVTNSTIYTTETVDGVTRYVYKLSDFFEMSSTTVKYADTDSYYNSTDKYVLEKYDLSIDFGNANISADKLAQETYLELKNSSGTSKYSNGNTEITYNLYYNKNAVMTETISNEDETYSVIEDREITFTLSVSLLEKLTAGGDRIIDTKYYDKIAGIAIEIVDENGTRIKHPDVQNLKLVNTNDATEQYTADENGVIRVPFIEGVGATSGEYKLSMSQNSVPPGTYSVKVYFFSSDDGKHYGDEAKIEKEFFAIFVSKLLGMIGIEATEDSRIVSLETGKNLEGNTGIDMTISIGDATAQTNIRAQLYKRTATYDANGNYTGTTYTLVNLNNYLQGTWNRPEEHGLISQENYEYIVWMLDQGAEPVTTEIETVELECALKEGVTTGEYKLVIESYYENTLVQTVRKTFIVTE